MLVGIAIQEHTVDVLDTHIPYVNRWQSTMNPFNVHRPVDELSDLVREDSVDDDADMQME